MASMRITITAAAAPVRDGETTYEAGDHTVPEELGRSFVAAGWATSDELQSSLPVQEGESTLLVSVDSSTVGTAATTPEEG